MARYSAHAARSTRRAGRAASAAGDRMRPTKPPSERQLPDAAPAGTTCSQPRRAAGFASVAVRPTVASTATASRTPSTAVARSGTAYGALKPDADACGPDATPISSAAGAAQRWRARQPRAAVTVSAVAPIPAATRPTAEARCRNVIRTRLQRVRSRAAATRSMAAIRRRPVRAPPAGGVVPQAATAAGTPGRGRLRISRPSHRSRAAAGAEPEARSGAVI
jgi:hypothetical protein